MNKTLSIKNNIAFGWKEFWSKPLFWILSYAIVIGITFNSSAVKDSFKEVNKDTQEIQPYTYNMDTSNYQPAKDITINTNDSVTTTNLNIEDLNSAIPMEKTIDVETKKPNYLPMILGIAIATPIALALGLLAFIVNQILSMGYIHLNLDAARGRKTEYKTLLSDVNIKKAFKVLGGALLYLLIVFLGLILLIVPGIYFALKYFWVHYFIVDKDITIKEAFKLSAEASKGIKLNTLVLLLTLGLLNLAGMLLLFIGIVPANIISSLAIANAYNTISDIKIKK